MKDARLLYKVERAAELLDVSRATVYELLRDGAIDSVKIGRSRRVPQAALDRYIAGLYEHDRTPAA